MINFRIFLNNLLRLYVIISADHNGSCLVTVWQPPSPNVSLSPVLSGKQSLVVSWLVNHSDLESDISEVQVSRTENHIIIHSENVSVAPLDEYTWLWTSDLPLECVDHSVRIRHFYKRSVVSRWSNWTTNPGVKTKDEIKIFPFQKMLREGTSAIFCCVPPPGENVTYMTVYQERRPLISVGARVKAVRVDNLTFKQSGNLLFIDHFPLSLGCYTAGHRHDIFNYITYPPQKPTDLSCVTSDTITVSCVWEPGRKRYDSNPNPQTQTLHIENSDQAPIICQRSSCSFPAIPLLEEYRIRVVVKNQVGEEAESHSFNISDRVFPVVEVDTVSPGVTNATMHWIVQGNLTQLTVFCQVNTAPQGTTELSCNSTNSRCRVQLEHLTPNTHYSTRVRCSVSGRVWGMWTQPLPFTTGPLVSVDLWRTIKQSSDPHSRQVTLLWTVDVPGSATKVEIQGYVVQWWQKGQNRAEMKDSGQTHMEVSIGPEQYDFTVEAVFHGGRSAPAHITIPKAKLEGEAPVEKQLSSSTVGGFNLSWAELVSATCGYTVEWCIQGHAVPCTLQWITIPDRNYALLLPAGDFKAGCRYTFNIYGCTENGHQLLEIQTGYSQELKFVQPPHVVEPIQRTSSSVSLEWRYDEDDPGHPAFITGYLVRVQDTLADHSANMFNVSVADPRRKSVTIEGLQENHEYVFSVSALTKNGPGEAVRVTIRTTANYSDHLAKTLIPFFLLLGCVSLLWPQRKMLKNGLKDIFAYPAGMNIKTSELQAFLNKADETVLSHKLEECICCDIEILNTGPRLEATTPLRDHDPTDTLPTPAFQSSTSTMSLSCVPFQVDYCPQSAMLPCHKADCQQTSIMNKSYFHSMAEDTFSSQVMSEIKSSFEPEGPQETCSVIYGYISKETFQE